MEARGLTQPQEEPSTTAGEERIFSVLSPEPATLSEHCLELILCNTYKLDMTLHLECNLAVRESLSLTPNPR